MKWILALDFEATQMLISSNMFRIGELQYLRGLRCRAGVVVLSHHSCQMSQKEGAVNIFRIDP
jgi:hypothetical protein